MTKHATVYWSLCIMATMALVGGGQLVGAAPRHACVPPDERVAAIVKSHAVTAAVTSGGGAVMRGGKTWLERVWGVADVEKSVGASRPTTDPAGSSTKQFTRRLCKSRSVAAVSRQR